VLFIFDWDGTISDSADKIVSCMQVAAKCAGFEPRNKEAIRNIIGLGMPEAMEALHPELSLEEKEQIASEYSRVFRAQDTQPSAFFSGALETLQHLKEQGFLLSVATGKSRQGLNRVLKSLNLNGFFHSSRCADETASKPHPLMLEEILEELKVPAEQAVMVGDTEYDMAMAKNIGMKKIAVSYGAHKLERLQKYQPEMCIDNFVEIRAWHFK